MCQHAPIDKVAVPCMFDAEGILTMPVSSPPSGLAVFDEFADSPRYLDAVAPHALSVVTLCG
jgi:hypothetical protein